MATFNDIAVLIAEPLGREMDSAFTAMLKARIKYWRAKLLRDTLNKTPKDRQFFTQYITVPLTSISTMGCSLPTDCCMMASAELPGLVRANSVVFDYVGAPDGSNPFKLIKRWEFPFFMANQYSPKVAEVYAWENRKILLVGNQLIPNILVGAIFDDPEVAYNLNCGTGADECSFEESEYPVSEEIAQMIVQYILQVDFNRRPSENKEEIDVDGEQAGDKA